MSPEGNHSDRKLVKIAAPAGGPVTPPDWALRQRHLIDNKGEAAKRWLSRVTHPDGTLIWRKEWPGMDGSDDGYEGFRSFPLLYLLGGAEYMQDLARRQWEAVTWQFTSYGQVYREFDAYYDWMHHGEGYASTYFMALCDPNYFRDRARCLRFAAMYMGEDPEAPNWDADLKMIRSPISGSRGPRSVMTPEDWVTHRSVLNKFIAVYEDVPGFESDDPFSYMDWEDDALFEGALNLMNQRMVPGDVPLNLNATSMATSAFMYTGDEKYKTWVLEYLSAWTERAKRNGGILPDNIGPNGEIGELMDGRWWGGYYGWRWPHGARTLLDPILVAGSNATLLTGDDSWLDLLRSQLDLLWSLRKEEDGVTVTPNKYSTDGWFDYLPVDPTYYVYLFYASHRPEDRQRIEERLPPLEEWGQYPAHGRWGGSFTPARWYAYMAGGRPDYPREALDLTYAEMSRRIDLVDNDDGDAEARGLDFWTDTDPVVPEGLIQLSMGTPGPMYRGGHLHADLRHFDLQQRRPGLPPGVAALVTQSEADHVVVELVNTDPSTEKELLIQAGAHAEHEFDSVEVASPGVPAPAVGERCRQVAVQLAPGASASLNLGLKRYAHQPTYALPDGIGKGK